MMSTYLQVFLFLASGVASALVLLNLIARIQILVSLKSELSLYSKLLAKYEPSSFANDFLHYDTALMQSRFFSSAWTRIKRNLIPPRPHDANQVVRITCGLERLINDQLATNLLRKEGRFVYLPTSAFLLLWLSACILFAIAMVSFAAMPTLGEDTLFSFANNSSAASAYSSSAILAAFAILLWGAYYSCLNVFRFYLGMALNEWRLNLEQLVLYTSVQQTQMIVAREFRDCIDVLEKSLEQVSGHDTQSPHSKMIRLPATTSGYPRVDDKTLFDYLPQP